MKELLVNRYGKHQLVNGKKRTCSPFPVVGRILKRLELRPADFWQNSASENEVSRPLECCGSRNANVITGVLHFPETTILYKV